MRICLNGEPCELKSASLAAALEELGFGEAKVATAVNGDFVPLGARGTRMLCEGDRVEVLSPMKGG